MAKFSPTLFGPLLASTLIALPLPAIAQDASSAPVSAAPAPKMAPASTMRPPLSAFGNIPALEDISLSPDGSRLAMVAMVQDRRMLLVLGKDKKVISAVPLDNSKLYSIRWAGNDYVLVTVRRSESLFLGAPIQEIPFTAVLDLTKPDSVKWVFDKKPDMFRITNGYYGARQIDGRWYGYFRGFRMTRPGSLDSAELHLFRVDLATIKVKLAENGGGPEEDRDWVIDGNGAVKARLSYYPDSGKWSIANAEGRKIASGVSPEGSPTMAGLNAEGTHLFYWQEDEAINDSRLFEIALADGSARATPSIPSDAERLYQDGRSDTVIAWGPGTFGSLPIFLDGSKNEIMDRLKKAFPGKTVRVTDFSTDINTVLFRTEGAGDPGTYYQMDFTARRAWPVGYEYPALKAEEIGAVEIVDYTAQDGMALDMIVTYPPGLARKNLPVVMLPHGGPHRHDTPSFDWWAQALASRGYVVVQPNFRGSTNKDRAFIEAGFGEWGGKMQTDVSDALAHLAAMGVVDPGRACIVGASYGGYAALAGVTLQQGLYKCAVSVAGVSDLPLMIADDVRMTYNVRSLNRYYKRAIGEGRDLKSISPINFAARADAPILLIHGKDDSVVYINQSEKMADKLKDAGKPYEFVVLPGEDHWLSRSETRMGMLEAVVAFVEKHNPPGPMASSTALNTSAGQ